MKKIIFIILILMTVAASFVYAKDEGTGGYPAAFLHLQLAARVAGLGGAYLSVADEPVAIFYNPAGLAQLKWNGVNASYRVMDFDRRLGFVAACFKAIEESSVGVGWIHASDGNIEGRDDEGVLTGEDLSYSDNLVAVSFSKRVLNKFMLGATGKYYITKVSNLTVNTVSFDLGAMMVLDKLNFFDPEDFLDNVRVGVVGYNLGGTLRWKTGDYYAQYGGTGVAQDEDLQIGLKFGASALMLDSSTLISAEVALEKDQDAAFFAGGEYWFQKMVAVRGGYSDGRYSFGGGVAKQFVYYRLRFDYAFVSGVDGEASNHLFTVGFEFR